MRLEDLEISTAGTIDCVCGVEFNTFSDIKGDYGYLSGFGIYYRNKSKYDLHLLNITTYPEIYNSFREDLYEARNMKDIIDVLKKHKKNKELNLLMFCLIKGRGVKERKK